MTRFDLFVACLALFFVIIAIDILAPSIKHSRSEFTAERNAKALAIALLAFHERFGSFPDKNTAEAIEHSIDKSNIVLHGNWSNDFFRQLIVTGIAKDENMFYAKTNASPRPPDNNMKGDRALGSGEVGFGYVMEGDRAINDSYPERVIALAPLLKGSHNGELDRKALNGMAIVIYANGRVEMLEIQNTNSVRLRDGHLLFDVGPDTIWRSDIHPKIIPPEP